MNKLPSDYKRIKLSDLLIMDVRTTVSFIACIKVSNKRLLYCSLAGRLISKVLPRFFQVKLIEKIKTVLTWLMADTGNSITLVGISISGSELEVPVSTSVITLIAGPGISFSMSDSISTLGISLNGNSIPDVGISGRKFQKWESVSIRGLSLEFNSRCWNTPDDLT